MFLHQSITQQVMEGLDLESWSLPTSILECYRQSGFSHMYKWQKECLNLPGVLEGKRNLVYSAPTGSGKTFIIEMILVKKMLSKKGKAILVFPYISVAREKLFWLQQLFSGTGVIVDGFMGGVSPPGGITSVDIAVCTIEKGNSLINKLIQDDMINQLSILAIDELHFIGDESRGYLLELMLTKLRFLTMQRFKKNDVTNSLSVQIIGFSATISNLLGLSQWLDAELFETSFRAIPLTRYIIVGNEVFDEKLNKIRDIKQIGDTQITSLCHETIAAGQSVLIFCPSKQWCENLSCTISQTLHTNVSSNNSNQHVDSRTKILEQLRETPAGLDNILLKTIPAGVAFHHAGLTMEERDLIETAFRQGSINVLLATSTLSSGVNLPAKRVIIRTPFFHGKLLGVHSFHQMAGRAGRKGCDEEGECIVICEKHEKEACKKLFSLPFPNVKSSLFGKEFDTTIDSVPGSLKKAILEAIGNKNAQSEEDVDLYVRSTFYSSQLIQHSSNIVQNGLNWLKEKEFITYKKEKESEKISVRCTKLGRASLLSSLSVVQSQHVFADLKTAAKSFALDTELHLMYLITPVPSLQEWSKLNWFNYAHILETLSTAEQRVAEYIGIEESFLMRMAASNSKKFQNLIHKHERIIAIHTRFYVTLILHELVQEVPLSFICTKYECNKGYVQSLQQSAASYAGMMTTFCKELGWWSFEMLLGEFQTRLFFGIQRDLLNLMKISVLNRKLARMLFDSGFTSCKIVAEASTTDIEKVLQKATKFFSFIKESRETEWEVEERRKLALIRLCDQKKAVTDINAAVLIIEEAKSVIKRDQNLAENTSISESQNKRIPQEANKVKSTSCGDKMTDVKVCVKNITNDIEFLSLIDSNPDLHENINQKDTSACTLESSIDLFDKSVVVDFSTSNGPFCTEFKDIFGKLTDKKYFAFCLLQNQMKETTFADKYLPNQPRGIAFCWSSDEVHFLNFEVDNDKQMWQSTKLFFSELTQMSIVVTFGAKECYKTFVKDYGIQIDCNWQDPSVAAWVLDSECHTALKAPTSIPDMRNYHYHAGQQIGKECTKQCREVCKQAHFTFTSMVQLKSNLISRCVWDYFNDIEMNHLLGIAHLEINGIPVQLKVLRNYKEKLSDILSQLQNTAWSAVGQKFNLYNPSEVSKVVFEKLNLRHSDGGSKNVVGYLGKSCLKHKSTNKVALQRLSKLPNVYPLANIIMNWRSVSHSLHKVIYPFCSNYLNSLDEIALHHPICCTKTSTGRVSMTEPSLQNIPKAFIVSTSWEPKQTKNEPCKNVCVSIRELFIATEGKLLLAADYSQLELRIMAHLSSDTNLNNLFGDSNADAFCQIATSLFHLKSTEMVTADQRQKSKQVCYGILYGMGPASLSEQIDSSESDAQTLIENFWLQYPLLKLYLNKIVENCKKMGYIETICKRRRSIPQINSSDFKLRSAAERQAVNSTIQGSAADLLKSATSKIQREIKNRNWNTLRTQEQQNGYNCYIIHTLHDELMYEVNFRLVKDAIDLVKHCMEHALPLNTNLHVKVSVGHSWESLKST